MNRPRFVPCTSCCDGWRIVTQPDGRTRAVRCPCLIAWKRGPLPIDWKTRAAGESEASRVS